MKIHTLVLGDLQTNCYIWADEGTGNAIVVDVPDSADKIIDFADKNGLKITDIILTHGHFDHMLGLAELKEKTGAELSVFEKTVDFINEKNLNLGFHMGVECPIAEADRILKDGDEIDFHGNKIKVIHTPGHTADSICLLLDDTLIKEVLSKETAVRELALPQTGEWGEGTFFFTEKGQLEFKNFKKKYGNFVL